MPDKIIYQDLSDRFKVNSVRYFSPSGIPDQTCPDIPTPIDSTASISIDIDKDNAADFVIEAVHNRSSSGCGSHCTMCFYYRISIIGQTGEAQISSNLKRNPLYEPVEYDSLSVIQASSSWRSSSVLYLYSPSAPFSATFGTMFIGVRLNNRYGWIRLTPYGNNGIQLTGCAINLAKNKAILAGQQK